MSSSLNYGLRQVESLDEIWLVSAYSSSDGPVAGVFRNEEAAYEMECELGGDPQFSEVESYVSAPAEPLSFDERKQTLMAALAQKRHLCIQASEEAHRLNIEVGELQTILREETF